MTAAGLRFDRDGLIPAVIQEAVTGEVLMVAWMDHAALEATQATGTTHFWSRSRQALWRKGETSGHVQRVHALWSDCDGDVLLVQVHQQGVACHTGHRTCFFTRQAGGEGQAGEAEAPPHVLARLEQVIASRKADAPPGSYVGGLLARGEAAVCRKIGEEAVEVVTAALGGEGDRRIVAEVADLWFHTLVLLGQRSIPLREVLEELARRHRTQPAPGG